MVSQNLTQEIVHLQADFCSTLSDPTRLLILYGLADRSCNVSELTTDLKLTQPTISRHLKVLREHGLVISVRTGTTIVYSLADRRLIDAIDLLRAVMRDRFAYRANLMEIVE